MAPYTRITIFCIAMSMGPLINGFQTQKSENPLARNVEPRIMTRQQAPPDPPTPPRETFMQRILAKIQGQPTTTPTPISTPRPVQQQALQLQPVGYNNYFGYQQPPPHFLYRYRAPFPSFRREKSESIIPKMNDSAAEEVPSQVTTTVAPPVSTTPEKSVTPARFHRGPLSESDSISIPILRSDIPDVEEHERKGEQKASQQPKCYVPQKSFVPLPSIPLPLYNNFGYGYPIGYQHLQPNTIPGGPYGNPFLPAPQFTRFPIIYFVLPKKKPTDKEPFDLISMEENKVVNRPVAAPSPHPQVEIEGSSSVEATTESTQKGTLESLSSLPTSKPTPVVESSMQEIVEIDVDPVSKLLDIMTGTSHEPTGEEKQEKDLVSLPSLRPIETDVVNPNSDLKSYLKTVDASEAEGSVNNTSELPRQRTRKFNLKRF